MFKRILAIIFNKRLSPKTINMLLEFAIYHRSRISMKAMLDANMLEMQSQNNGHHIDEVKQNEKNRCWYEVYGIEELFKEAGLFINVGVDEFTNEADLMLLVNQSKCDLLVICEPGEMDLKKIDKLAQHTEVPIFIIPA